MADRNSNDFPRYIFPAALALSAIAIWIILSFHCQDLLLKIESRSLFLTTDLYFKERMLSVGGLLTYISCFLTLFLQFPPIGALTAVILWCCVTLLTKKTFHLEGGASALAFIPAAILIAADMQSGYMIFAYRDQGWFFLPSLGFLTTLTAVYCYNRIENNRNKLIFIIIWTLAAYPLSGFYALLGTAAIAVQALAKPSGSNILQAAAAIAAIALFPRFWSGTVYYTGRVAASYIAALPQIFDMNEYHTLWIPYIILVAATLFLAYIGSPTKRLPTALPDIASYLTGTVISILSVWIFWYDDPDFINDLKMDSAIERQDWKEVVRIHDRDTRRFARHNARVFSKRSRELETASHTDRDDIIAGYEYKFHIPTRTMVMYKDLALLRLGTAGSQAFCHAEGDYMPPSPVVISLAIQCGKQLYYNYGIPNFCYRWCIEDAVEYGWSVEVLKYAIRCTVIGEDWDIADKYISQLEHSPFHRKWAKKQRELLHHPELIRESDEYRSILPLMCGTDDINSDESMIEKFIMEHFITYNWLNSTAEGCEAAMLWILRAQNIRAFWAQLANWIFTHPDKTLPRHYQEAAYLYEQLEGRSIPNLEISPEVIRSYDRFMKFNASHPIRNLRESSYIYGQDFGDTFYYYYFFARDQQTH